MAKQVTPRYQQRILTIKFYKSYSSNKVTKLLSMQSYYRQVLNCVLIYYFVTKKLQTSR